MDRFDFSCRTASGSRVQKNVYTGEQGKDPGKTGESSKQSCSQNSEKGKETGQKEAQLRLEHNAVVAGEEIQGQLHDKTRQNALERLL